MMRRILPLIFILLSSFSHASTCSYLANQINADIARYSTTPGNKQLPWMNFTWIKNQLGFAEVHRISPTEREYKWVCPEDTDAYLAVIVDSHGRIINIEGIYSGNEGSGTLSFSMMSAATVKQVTTALSSTQKSSCTDVINQIHDIAAKGNASAKHYVWEDLAWLKDNFGSVKLQTNNNIFGYEWICNGESLLYFIKQGQIIFSATKCINGNCNIVYASRVSGNMKGFTTKTALTSAK